MKLTDFDYITGDRHLQMLKAALPYVNVSEQKFLSVLVRCQELRRTISLFHEEETASMGICSLGESASRSPLDMLEAMKPYGDAREQDFIDMICNLIQGWRLGTQGVSDLSPDHPACSSTIPPSVSASASAPRRPPLEQLKTFLSPEQQSRLDTMTMLMQAMQQFT